eukprot:TRINITY_DN25074_c0_g1_i1.p1 TRINITY_DN25074_c0_g1~~TRINITY_DN25074_c0_g1_i1.p1  ORF type:complete len:495 (-),score=107.34 TRINITY_DN25074_c0_g1_i1:46-1530(-)
MHASVPRDQVLRVTLGLAAGLTAASLLWRWRCKQCRPGKSGRRCGSKRECCHCVSSRGMRLNMPSLAFMGGVIDFKDPYKVETIGSLEGAECAFLALAENKLMWDVLKPRLLKALQQIPDCSFSYIPMQGQVALRKALSKFLEKRVVKVPVPPQQLVCGTGVSAELSNLFYCICEDDDTVLIPAPYYSAFDSDLRAFCNLHRLLVPLDPEADYALTVEALEAAYARSIKRNGRAPKALLLTNPHNPLGRIAPREELKVALDWCSSKGMHLVSDEVYALSCFGQHMEAAKRTVSGGSSFVSLAEVCGGRLSENVHIIWGVSKDFGMAGVRLGVVWTQNGLLLEALRNASKFTSVSGPTQAMVTDLMSDEEFVEAFVRENTQRLAASCEFLMQQLELLDISFVVPAAGMFVWADLWPVLTWLAKAEGGCPAELEDELHERLLNEVGMVINPGRMQHAPKPGFFRICYASVPLHQLRDAMARFSSWAAALRQAAETC